MVGSLLLFKYTQNQIRVLELADLIFCVFKWKQEMFIVNRKGAMSTIIVSYFSLNEQRA